MTSRRNKGNPRIKQAAVTVNADVAKKRAAKTGAALSGNPRAKNNAPAPEIDGFKKETISEVKVKPAVRQKEESKKLKKIRKQKKHSPEKREKRRSVKKVVLITFLFLLLAGIIGGVVYLLTSDTLEIREVEYVGAEHLTQAECEALAPSPEGQNLITFDKNTITQGFLRDSWVEKVSFNRVFPHKLEIQITEKKIGAVVEFNSGANQTSQSWIITLDGTWIMGVPKQDSDVGKTISQNIFTDADSAVHIKDCPNGIAPEMGKACTDETVLNALKIMNEFSTDLKDEVQSITASNINATTLQLKNNVEIAFGAAENVREKERITKEILSQNDKVVYVNVRSIDRPTWRSASASG